MNAQKLIDRRVILASHLFAQLVLWKLPNPVIGSLHPYKYRLALVSRNVCVLRFDNEAGKGDHYHLGDDEYPYRFQTVGQLLVDFEAEIKRWRDAHPDA